MDITQQHLANRAGIERTALGRIEKGERKVSAVELVNLAAALDVPLAWFVRDPLPAVVSRRTDAAPGHEVTARMDRQLELFSGDVEALRTSGIISPPAVSRPWRTPRSHLEAEQTAHSVRAHLGVGDGPLLGLASVAEHFGLYSCSVALGDDGADGALVEVAKSLAATVIDGNARSGRRRMSLAHELGHWLFGDSYDAGADETEKWINSFAAHFLAPRAGITTLWNQHLDGSVRDRAIRVAAEFRMSWSAMILHLRNVDLISKSEYRSLDGRRPLAGEFAKLGITLDTEELKPPSLSPGITAAIVEAYVDRRMSATRVVELLRGSLTTEDLPEQRAETAADYVSR